MSKMSFEPLKQVATFYAECVPNTAQAAQMRVFPVLEGYLRPQRQTFAARAGKALPPLKMPPLKMPAEKMAWPEPLMWTYAIRSFPHVRSCRTPA
ncbi:MAG: hypothetical protein AAFO28_06575 [Pseudomonadota bacterium]